jgi:hypothetical protein
MTTLAEQLAQARKELREAKSVVASRGKRVSQLKQQMVTERFPDLDPQHMCLGTWECPQSPTGECAYDMNSEMGDDDCIFCHHPEERL